MSDAEWEDAYRAAWAAYYTPDHIRTILRRSAACKLGRPGTTLSTILWFYLMILFEGVHPLEGGALRLKFRRDRRHGMPRESPSCSIRATAARPSQDVALLVGLSALQGDPRRGAGGARSLDLQRSRHRAAESRRYEALDLYHATAGGEAALARKYRGDAIREGGSTAPKAAAPSVAATVSAS